MRIMIILALLLTLATPAHAYNRGLKIAGIVTTFIGFGLVITGSALLAADYTNAPNRPPHSWDAGIATFVLGSIGVAAGIPMWAVGASGGRRYRAQLLPAPNGLMLRF